MKTLSILFCLLLGACRTEPLPFSEDGGVLDLSPASVVDMSVRQTSVQCGNGLACDDPHRYAGGPHPPPDCNGCRSR